MYSVIKLTDSEVETLCVSEMDRTAFRQCLKYPVRRLSYDISAKFQQLGREISALFVLYVKFHIHCGFIFACAVFWEKDVCLQYWVKRSSFEVTIR